MGDGEDLQVTWASRAGRTMPNKLLLLREYDVKMESTLYKENLHFIHEA
jgi:hypothetical protein